MASFVVPMISLDCASDAVLDTEEEECTATALIVRLGFSVLGENDCSENERV
jgi:hypothetical protein